MARKGKGPGGSCPWDPKNATRLLSLVPSPAADLRAARWSVNDGQVCKGCLSRGGATGEAERCGGGVSRGLGGSQVISGRSDCARSGQDSNFKPWYAEG